MAKTNIANKKQAFTHEGGVAFPHLTPMQALRRSVCSCLLWEKDFYESGESIATRITELAWALPPEDVAALAIEARTKFNLRHVPLWLLTTLASSGAGKPKLVQDTVYEVINRADELGELVSLYYKANGGRKPLSNQFKKGLARAFSKFDDYQLAKYNRDGAVKLRDVAFLSHVKPQNGVTLAKLCNKSFYPEATKSAKFPVKANYSLGEYESLASPDTWEVQLSAGADKKETFERLLAEGKLGYLALLRNLRNMDEAGVNPELVKTAILARKGANRVFPFRYIAAARHAPRFEPELDQALLASIKDAPRLEGMTSVLVDVSGSMDYKLGKSEMSRMDYAAALAAIVPSDNMRVFTFSDRVVEVPPRKGMGGVEAVVNSQMHNGTWLARAVEEVNQKGYDRLIVLSDEQAHDGVVDPLPNTKAYMINLASYQNGVGYGKWVHIDGMSEAVIRFISEYEKF